MYTFTRDSHNTNIKTRSFMITNIEVEDIISKSRTKFRVLAVGAISTSTLPASNRGKKKTTNNPDGRLILLEQMDSDKVIAYEVCRSYYGINRFDLDPLTQDRLYEHIPSAEQFGRFVLDRSFPIRDKELAFDWFRSHVVLGRLTKGEPDLLGALLAGGGGNVMQVKVNPDGSMPEGTRLYHWHIPN